MSEEQAAGAMRLVVKRAGAETDIEFPFVAPATVGRFDPEVGPIEIDLGTIPEGQYVSRRHARFEMGDDGLVVKDLGSSNGTFILRDDFERVEEAAVADGDEIAFGNARLVLRIGSGEAEPEAEPAAEAEPELDQN